MQRVTSRQNPLVSRYRDVAQGDVDDRLLLDGVHLVSEALASGIAVREAVVSSEALDRADITAIVEQLTRYGVEIVAASPMVMDAVSPVRSSSPIVAIAERPAHDAARIYASGAPTPIQYVASGPATAHPELVEGRALGAGGRTVPLVIIAADVQDPGNVGAIVRVAEAGGASAVVMAGHSADPFGWKALRGSMGSALRLPIVVRERAGQAVDEARQHGCRIVATVPRNGQSLFSVDLTVGVAVLVGGEGAGIEQRLTDEADVRVTIPMRPPVESLNTAVTAALIVYEARRQQGAVL